MEDDELDEELEKLLRKKQARRKRNKDFEMLCLTSILTSNNTFLDRIRPKVKISHFRSFLLVKFNRKIFDVKKRIK